MQNTLDSEIHSKAISYQDTNYKSEKSVIIKCVTMQFCRLDDSLWHDWRRRLDAEGRGGGPLGHRERHDARPARPAAHRRPRHGQPDRRDQDALVLLQGRTQGERVISKQFGFATFLVSGSLDKG